MANFVGELWGVEQESSASPGQCCWVPYEKFVHVCLLNSWVLSTLVMVLNSSAAVTQRSQVDSEGFSSPKSFALGFNSSLREQKTRELGTLFPQQVTLFSALSWARGAAASQERPDCMAIQSSYFGLSFNIPSNNTTAQCCLDCDQTTAAYLQSVAASQICVLQQLHWD